MKRFILFLALVTSVFGATQMRIENGVLVNDLNANSQAIINLEAPVNGTDAATKSYVDFAVGSGTGTGGGLTSISLTVPTPLFLSPVNFSISGSAATGTLSLGNAPAGTVFTNLSTLAGPASFAPLSGTGSLKTAMALDQVNNTTDANKPVSTAQATAINAVSLSSAAKPTANVDLNNFNIINLANPTSATQAANKQYVDALASAGPPHAAVAAATTPSGGNIALSGEQTIDGVLTSASRVLVKNQTAGTDNGIYVSGSGAWARAADANTGPTVAGNVFVTGGTANGGTQWGVTTPQPITIGTTVISYTLTGQSTIYTAGQGLTLSGSQFSITNNGVSNGMLAIAPAQTIKGNNNSIATGPGAVVDLNNSQAKSILAITESDVASLTSDLASKVPTSRNLITTAPLQISAPPPPGNVVSGLTVDLSQDRTISETQAGTGSAGWLSSTDWNAFNAKVPSTRALITTAPLTISTATTPISGGAGSNLSSDRTIAMPASTNVVDGYLTAVDHTSFTGKATADSIVQFHNSTGNAGSSSGSPATWTTGATTGVEVDALTGTHYALLPPAGSYPPGKRIIFTDPVTTLNFGRVFRPVSTPTQNTINGSTLDFPPAFIAGNLGAFGSRSIEFISDGNTNWQSSTTGTLFHVEAPTNASQYFTFDATAQTAGSPGSVFVPPNTTVTVIPSTPSSHQFVTKIDGGGNVITAQPAPTDLLPNVYPVGTKTVNIPTVPPYSAPTDDGSIDTVVINGILTASYTIRWPHALNYPSGTPVRLVDASGTVSATNFITIVSTGAGGVVGATGSDTFSNSTNFVMDEGYGEKTFISDGASNWTVATTKTSIQPYTVLSPVGIQNLFTLPATQHAVKHNAHLPLRSGTNTFAVTNPYDGMSIELVLIQPSSGARGTLTLPSVSAVGAIGNGVVVLTDGSVTPGAVDRLRGTYDGQLGWFLWDQPILNHTTGLVPNAPTVLTATNPTGNSSTINLAWTAPSGGGTPTSYKVLRADNTSTGTPVTWIDGLRALTPTTYSDSSLAPNTPYNYAVVATNSAGDSAPSNTATATTSMAPVGADLWEIHLNEGSGTNAGHTGTAGPDGLLSYASWTATANTANGNPSALHVLAGMVAPTVTVTPTSATGAATNYSYRVYGYKTTPNYHTAGVTKSITSPSGGPSQLDANNFNTISWTAVTGATYYEVWRTTDGRATGANTGRIATNIPAGTLSLVDNGITETLGMANIPSVASTDAYNVTARLPGIDYTLGSTLPGNTMTFSFWVNSTYAGVDTIANLGNGNVVSLQGGGTLAFSLRGTTGTMSATISSSAISGGWHHIAVVMNNSTTGNTPSTGGSHPPTTSDNLQVFFDGVQQTLNFGAGNPTRVGPATFPNFQVIAGGTGVFTGDVDDVRIYSALLSQSQISTLTSNGPQ